MFSRGSILHTLGKYGPFIMFIFSLIIMKSKTVTTYAYILGFVLNTIINPMIKLIIKQRRPDREKSTTFISAIIDQSKNINDLKHPPSFIEEATDAHRYGMPSGHAQTAFFSLVYVWLTYRNIKITSVYMLLTIITCIQRIITRKHYLDQVVIGAIIGGVLAVFFFTILSSLLKSL